MFTDDPSPWKAAPMISGLFLVAIFNLDLLGVKVHHPRI